MVWTFAINALQKCLVPNGFRIVFTTQIEIVRVELRRSDSSQRGFFLYQLSSGRQALIVKVFFVRRMPSNFNAVFLWTLHYGLTRPDK
jgi:hypothetical protein